MKTSYLRPLRLLVFFPSYAGNGGYSSLSAKVSRWWSRTRAAIVADPRIGHVEEVEIGDTPITMTRNRVVKMAQEGEYDLVLMVDSDMDPDLYVGQLPEAKPFWETAFEFAYARMRKELPTVVFAPYCGPPPIENPYVFYWEEYASETHGGPSLPDQFNGLTLSQYTRTHAADMTGIQPAAAGPTGAILYTIDAFDCRAPRDQSKPYFYYEYKDAAQTEKASTEDVTNTRDISLGAWVLGLGDVVFCAWDCWWGHLKNKSVGKPFKIGNGRAAEKIHLALQAEEEAKFADLKAKHPEWFADPEPDPAPVEPDAATAEPARPRANEYAGKFAPAAIGDGRWSPKELKGLEATLESVLKTRTSKGAILVCYDRDLAASKLAMDHVMAALPRNDDDVTLYWHPSPSGHDEQERAALEDNLAELDKGQSLYGIFLRARSDVRPENVDYDRLEGAVHLVVDLRKTIDQPIARHAYAYFALSKPEWGETFYRLATTHGRAATWIHEDYLPAAEAPVDERQREPICG